MGAVTNQQFDNLKPGDRVINTGSKETYDVLKNLNSGRVMLVKAIDATNPSEWELVVKAQRTLVNLGIVLPDKETS